MTDKYKINKLGKLFNLQSNNGSNPPPDGAEASSKSAADNPKLNRKSKSPDSDNQLNPVLDKSRDKSLEKIPKTTIRQRDVKDYSPEPTNQNGLPSDIPPQLSLGSVLPRYGTSKNLSYSNLPDLLLSKLLKINDNDPIRQMNEMSGSSKNSGPVNGTGTFSATSKSGSASANNGSGSNGGSGTNSRVNSPPMSRSNSIVNKPRFRLTETSHEHNLKSAKRQEKLSNMLKDLLGAKKLRDEAKLAVPNILGDTAIPSPAATPAHNGNAQPPTLFAGLVNQVKHFNDNSVNDPSIDQSFVEKYGRCQEVIGKGSFGTVRVSHKKGSDSNEVLYAVKEFKKRPNELEKKFNRRLTSEFCISSSLKNINIIDTLDLLKDAKGDYVEVMEYCPGGDLYTLIIASGKLEYAEADCFFKQLIKGVNYMHDMGVSHRDLKPENLLLTSHGVLKITDFGNSECFKMAWEDTVQLSEGICGSSPYIAPEEFTSSQFDSRCVDIWSCGVIYMAMRTGRQLWQVANPEKDEFFEEYLIKRKNSSGYEPIESLKRARCRNVIYSILDPKPSRRITGKQILNSEWGREIKLCDAALGKAKP